jgi:hypothetical protein
MFRIIKALLHRVKPVTTRRNSCRSFCALLAALFTLFAENNLAKNLLGDAPNNHGIITQGQHGNNYLGQLPRHLSDQEKADFLSKLPRDRNIEISFEQSDSDTANLADEIKTFLNSNGWTISKFQGAIMFTANGTPRGVFINLNLDKPELPVEITVGIK